MEYSERFENFWMKYDARQKGPKRKAYESWLKVCKTWSKEEKLDNDEVAFSQHVFRGYEAVIKNRKAAEKAKQFVPQLPHCTTWLNQYRFEEEQATSTSEYRDMTEPERVCDCGSTRIIGRTPTQGWLCYDCDQAAWKAGEYCAPKPSLGPLIEKYPKSKSESWMAWHGRVVKQMRIKNDATRKVLRNIDPDAGRGSRGGEERAQTADPRNEEENRAPVG